VTGQVRLGGAGPRALSVGVVRESRYWYAREAFPSALVLTDPTATPIPALTKRTILPLSTRNGGP
jgi:hypothetical protein